jgi:hypothetical protein
VSFEWNQEIEGDVAREWRRTCGLEPSELVKVLDAKSTRGDAVGDAARVVS